ncbi:chloride channel protein [Nanchangia anserum]|uniref:Chloride channel protein n=1 Tax=Nanchangia anserum TaxID=2692125 RepID=A0A8I0KQ84_9ACTO|nr:chloride channel protein [Nanchangia anserum]MBD3689705.1 chloride channel protein [Nanchangia anserum]QOX82538.1 chloride channel protein [Nanchangia anserum]
MLPALPGSLRRVVARNRIILALIALVIGAIVGGASVLFHYCIEAWTWVMTGYTDYPPHAGAPHGTWGFPSWFIIVVPVISGLIYGPLIQRFAPSARGHGVPEVMLAVARQGGRIPGRVALVKIIGSALTLGGGGSVGREGPIVQVGASLGSWISSTLNLPRRRVILFAGCGSAAGIAATFNAPLAGACFAMEVILGGLSATTFSYVLFASVAASVVSHALLGDHPAVELPHNLSLAAAGDLWWVVAVAIIAGLAGLGFAKFLYVIEDAVDRLYRWPEWARPALGSLLLGLGLWAFPVMYGAGGSVQVDTLSGTYGIGALLALCVGRAIFTAYTIAIGGSGGVFAPSLAIGATAGMAVGLVVSPLSASDAAVYGVIGMGAAFAAAARAPLTAALIIVEMTGQYSLILPMLLAVAVATGMSRYLTSTTIYTEKLLRRGDTLRDPVEHTVMGRRTAGQLMHPVPPLLSAESTIDEAVRAFNDVPDTSLPVIRRDQFLGSVTRLALMRASTTPDAETTTVGDLDLITDCVAPDTLPSRFLGVMEATPLRAVPVVNAERRVVGVLRIRDLVQLLYDEQHRALHAGDEVTSWGQRMQQRFHEGAWRPHWPGRHQE